MLEGQVFSAQRLGAWPSAEEASPSPGVFLTFLEETRGRGDDILEEAGFSLKSYLYGGLSSPLPPTIGTNSLPLLSSLLKRKVTSPRHLHYNKESFAGLNRNKST